jgi:tyrosine-protein phosphatase SIW14
MRIACCALLLTCCLSTRAELRDLQRIDDNVYRGRQPGKTDFPELAQMGIKTVLDLRGGMIHEPKERKLVEAAGMHYVGVRLSGIWPPKPQQMAEILALLEDPALGPVFVHCRRGGDRAGMVIACYRIAHDHWTNAEALQEARHHRMSILELLMQRYIRHFDPSKLPAPAKEG